MREEEMNCKDICELLTAYLDGEVTPKEKAYIEAHLPGCPECSAELEALSATQTSLRGVLKSMAEEVSPSPQAWEKARAQVGKKGSWLDGLHRLLTSKTWQVATVTAAVVIIAVVAAIWQFGGIGQAPPPAPTPTPVPAPAPRPAPPPPFERSVVPEEAHYLPGEPIEVKLAITNTSSDVCIVDPSEVHLDTRVYNADGRFDIAVGPLKIGAGGRPCVEAHSVIEVKIFPRIGFTDQQHRVHYEHILNDDLRKLGTLKPGIGFYSTLIFDGRRYLEGNYKGKNRREYLINRRDQTAPSAHVFIVRPEGTNWYIDHEPPRTPVNDA